MGLVPTMQMSPATVMAPHAEGTPEPAVPNLGLVRAQLAAAASSVSGPQRAKEYLDLLERSPRALYRDGGPVHLTASAIVVDAPGEQVALVWHRKGEFWVQPGGHLEPGEIDLELAARREVAEETGLEELERVGDGPAMLHQHDLSAAFGRCRAHWDVQYLLRAPAPASAVPLRASDESPKVRWVPWPRRPGRAGRDLSALPAGTVADLPETLAALARLVDAQR